MAHSVASEHSRASALNAAFSKYRGRRQRPRLAFMLQAAAASALPRARWKKWPWQC